jgi:lipopolysaccharide/colanic/teichoic acid biosynthesis glycosyltransferase
MSFVGPRPEVPQYVAVWPEEDRERILSVRPGITDYVTLYFYDEQAVLAKSGDPERTYIRDIIPNKLELYKDYIRDQDFGLDIRLIIMTLLRVMRPRSRA